MQNLKYLTLVAVLSLQDPFNDKCAISGEYIDKIDVNLSKNEANLCILENDIQYRTRMRHRKTLL